MSPEDLLQAWIASVRDRDLDHLSLLVHPDMCDNTPLPSQAQGLDGFLESISDFLSAFPDLQVNLIAHAVAEDRIFFHTEESGTLAKQAWGLGPVGTLMTWTELCCFRIEDGLLREFWSLSTLPAS
jgi:predicted ester cyclase